MVIILLKVVDEYFNNSIIMKFKQLSVAGQYQLKLDEYQSTIVICVLGPGLLSRYVTYIFTAMRLVLTTKRVSRNELSTWLVCVWKKIWI